MWMVDVWAWLFMRDGLFLWLGTLCDVKPMNDLLKRDIMAGHFCSNGCATRDLQYAHSGARRVGQWLRCV